MRPPPTTSTTGRGGGIFAPFRHVSGGSATHAELGLIEGDAFLADAKVVSDGTIWVRLLDGRGWLFIERAGEVVLERIDPADMQSSAPGLLAQVKTEVAEVKTSLFQGPTLLADTASPRSLDGKSKPNPHPKKGFFEGLKGPTLLADTASPRSLDRRRGIG